MDEANRLISEGNATDGATKANEVLATSDDPKIWEKASAILARNRPTGFAWVDVAIRDFFATLGSTLGWILALIGALVVLAFLVLPPTVGSTHSPAIARQKGKLVAWRYRR